MPTYSLVITAADGRQHVNVTEFDDDASAIREAGTVISAEHPSVPVARGAGGEAELLGAWDFEAGRGLWWSEQ